MFFGKGTVYEKEKHAYHPNTHVYFQKNAYVDGDILDIDFERRLKPFFIQHYNGGELKHLHFLDNLKCPKKKDIATSWHRWAGTPPTDHLISLMLGLRWIAGT